MFGTVLMYGMYGMPILQEQKSVTPQSRKKTINRDALRKFVWRRVMRLPYRSAPDNNLFGILFH